jgi:D-alanine-D-alanine ligase
VDASLVARLRDSNADVAFVALHGRGGEDGTVQEILEIVGMPYTGSGVLACMCCMDKVLTKHLLAGAELSTPDFFAFSEVAFREFGAADALPAIEEQLGFPIVVKPAAQGSALGIKFAASAEDIPGALVAAFSYDDRVLLERHVKGRELAVSLLEREDGVEALPVVEAKPKQEYFFDFEARYEIGKTDYACPAKLSPEVTARAQELAVETYRLLGCYGFARVDMILSEEDSLEVLEAQAIPGLTETSLLPQAAEAAGVSFDKLVERLVELAMARSGAVAAPS